MGCQHVLGVLGPGARLGGGSPGFERAPGVADRVEEHRAPRGPLRFGHGERLRDALPLRGDVARELESLALFTPADEREREPEHGARLAAAPVAHGLAIGVGGFGEVIGPEREQDVAIEGVNIDARRARPHAPENAWQDPRRELVVAGCREDLRGVRAVGRAVERTGVDLETATQGRDGVVNHPELAESATAKDVAFGAVGEPLGRRRRFGERVVHAPVLERGARLRDVSSIDAQAGRPHLVPEVARVRARSGPEGRRANGERDQGARPMERAHAFTLAGGGRVVEGSDPSDRSAEEPRLREPDGARDGHERRRRRELRGAQLEREPEDEDDDEDRDVVHERRRA